MHKNEIKEFMSQHPTIFTRIDQRHYGMDERILAGIFAALSTISTIIFYYINWSYNFYYLSEGRGQTERERERKIKPNTLNMNIYIQIA